MILDSNSIDVRSSRQAIKEWKKAERTDRHYFAHKNVGWIEMWPQYDSTLEKYNDYFSGVLPTPDQGIKGFVEFLVKENGGNGLRVLEPAGQGTELLEIKSSGIDTVTAVGLNDFRGLSRRFADKRSGLSYKTLDITEPANWEKLGKNRYNFTIFRPVGALELITSPRIQFFLINEMYESLTSNGAMLLQVDERTIQECGTGWIQKLAETSGLNVNYEGNSLSSEGHVNPLPPNLLILKGGNAPKNLSFLMDILPDPTVRMKDFKQINQI